MEEGVRGALISMFSPFWSAFSPFLPVFSPSLPAFSLFWSLIKPKSDQNGENTGKNGENGARYPHLHRRKGRPTTAGVRAGHRRGGCSSVPA